MTNPMGNSKFGEPKGFQTNESEQSCAEQVVRRLLQRAGLQPLISDATLAVSIGEGNWVSYECEFVLESETALDEIARRANQSNEKRLRRSAKRGESNWFRSEGAPSLHFQIVPSGDVLRCRGHVDAAHPFTNPFAHFVHDYLPARGVGKHPFAAELLTKMQRQND